VPSAILPVAKMAFVCDDVVGDKHLGKTSVLNLFNTVRLLDENFPYRLGKLCVFAEFKGGLGIIPVHVEIAQADTGELLYRSPDFVLSFTDRTKTHRAKCKLQKVILPSAGTYFVELYCNDEFVDDQPIRVISVPV
jgi:hypothetical protein